MFTLDPASSRGAFLSQSSGESVSSELVRSTLPVYWDDPAHPNTLNKVLVSTFQGGGKQTKASGSEVPLSTFLITVNFTLDDDIRCVGFLSRNIDKHFRVIRYHWKDVVLLHSLSMNVTFID